MGHLRNGCLLLVVLFFAICDAHKKEFSRLLAIAITACVVLNGVVNLFGATGQNMPIQTRHGMLLGHKRDTAWTGYMVHVSETCEPTAPHLLTHVHTTPATVHEAQCTSPIQQALIEKELPPRDHFVDAAYISAALLVAPAVRTEAQSAWPSK